MHVLDILLLAAVAVLVWMAMRSLRKNGTCGSCRACRGGGCSCSRRPPARPPKLR